MDEIELKYVIANRFDNKVQTNYAEFEATLKEYLNAKCIEHGSTLAGRINSFNKVTGAKQKSCIYINKRTFLIPSVSMRAKDVCLINYWMIQKVKRVNDHETLVLFKDNTIIKVNCDARVLNKQISRCATYISKMI